MKNNFESIGNLLKYEYVRKGFDGMELVEEIGDFVSTIVSKFYTICAFVK